MLIDAHCHFFTKNMLAERFARSEHISGHIGRAFKRRQRRDTRAQGGLLSGLNTIDFLRIGYENTPVQMYELMQESYGCDFIAVPLMLDLTYALVEPKTQAHDRHRGIFFWLNPDAQQEEPIKARSSAMEHRLDMLERSVLGVDLFQNAYQTQIEELTEAQRQLPGRVFPFFSIDPRRDDEFDGGVLGEIKKYVGADKPFRGLKLYTSLGYSPTNPVLYDDSDGESVYGYCEKNNIPVTVHAALEGFSHLLRQGVVEGDIYYEPADSIVPAGEIYKEGVITYKNRLRSFDFNAITQERLLLLNHPMLWRKVLEKYPKLKLCMAHFGGIAEMGAYLKDGRDDHWAPHIVDIMHDFPGVYTDLSFFYEEEARPDFVRGFYDKVYKQLPRKVRNRVIYGSDYFMIALYDAGLSDYIKVFRSVFGKEFAHVSERNPRRFLDI